MVEGRQFKLPGSIVKCEVCGEYRGAVMKKELNWEGSFFAEVYSESDETITVSCLCDGIPCPRCKKNLIHRPISNKYDSESNTIWHHPYFSGMVPCVECQERSQRTRRSHIAQ